MAKAIFQLETLTCPSCVKKIEAGFAKTAGVESSNVLFNLSKVTAEYDGDVLKASELTDKLEKLGFSVVSTKVS